MQFLDVPVVETLSPLTTQEGSAQRCVTSATSLPSEPITTVDVFTPGLYLLEPALSQSLPILPPWSKAGQLPNVIKYHQRSIHAGEIALFNLCYI